MEDSDNEDENGPSIARRTRSNYPIDDFEPNDNLDFPDVEKDLYQDPNSEGGDITYKNFLTECYSKEIGTDTNTEDNDPEYIYNDDILSHGWRYSFSDFFKQHDYEQDALQIGDPNDELSVKVPDGSIVAIRPESKSPHKRRKIDMFEDPEFARVLNQQLRQHIQLLTQAFLLTKNTTNMTNENEEAKNHLLSYMKIFKNKSKPSNLLPAMNLVNNLVTPKDLKSNIRLSWRPLPIPEQVKNTLIDNPDIFIYPRLLPQVAFSNLPEKLLPKKPKINFTNNEDKLLAYALNEFKGESTPYAFIASLLMAPKTKVQISNHIKNIKRSPGNENNPIRLYYSNGELPEIDLDADSELVKIEREEENSKIVPIINFIEQSYVMEQVEIKEDVKLELAIPSYDSEEEKREEREEVSEIREEPAASIVDSPIAYQDQDDLMNMDLDDLMAASTTISKSSMLNNVNNSENKNIKNLKLKKSMLSLMSHNFNLPEDMGNLIIYEFLKVAQQKLGERNNLHLLQLLTDLTKKETNNNSDSNNVFKIYHEITNFLEKIQAPSELHDRLVLFLDLDQSTKCGCAMSYIYWMRFFEFIQHVEICHDGVEASFERKLARLIDALQKVDSHKIKLAVGNLINKHPFLKRGFESLDLNEKPHSSLFICEEDFDDITDPILLHDKSINEKSGLCDFEHFNLKTCPKELSYASQSCPCRCHSGIATEEQPNQHCGKCNLKFMKGRMFLVNKIKPILAEWSYLDKVESPQKTTLATIPTTTPTTIFTSTTSTPKTTPTTKNNGVPKWSLEEDREILEFCRSKAEQNEESISFDVSTFEELVNNSQVPKGNGGSCKKSAREIADRFNQLMEMYKGENLGPT